MNGEKLVEALIELHGMDHIELHRQQRLGRPGVN